MQRWLAEHWVAGAIFMAGLQLALLPALVGGWASPVLLIYLHGPAYMIHQVEEHWGDRFRQFTNDQLFKGQEVLTTKGVLWINLPGVWGVNLLALLAARLINPGLGLAAAYLVLINAAGHIGMALHTKASNPGVWSATAFFVPLGVLSVLTIPANLPDHVLGIAIAGGLHAAIALGCLRRSLSLSCGSS